MSSLGTLVDSNVLLDLFSKDPRWAPWSSELLAAALNNGPMVINQIVYGEVSLRFSSIEVLEAELSGDRFVRASLPGLPRSLPPAPTARSGTRTSTLPDFFIGHTPPCSASAWLTRGAARYRTYFPAVALIAP